MAPLHSNGHWMSRREYASFIQVLSERYDVAFTDNLSAAKFNGMRVSEEPNAVAASNAQ